MIASSLFYVRNEASIVILQLRPGVNRFQDHLLYIYCIFTVHSFF